MMVLDKGLTGWYLLLAITVISEKLFSASNGSVTEGKAPAYGHSYTGNALGCAAAKASLEVLKKDGVLEAVQPKIRRLISALAGLRELSGVKEVRQCGFIAGIEVEDFLETARPAVAEAVCITIAQLTKAVKTLRADQQGLAVQ
jgi:adenosylmethionine---8-amino-7-oxononanoate aminotransferase